MPLPIQPFFQKSFKVELESERSCVCILIFDYAHSLAMNLTHISIQGLARQRVLG